MPQPVAVIRVTARDCRSCERPRSRQRERRSTDDGPDCCQFCRCSACDIWGQPSHAHRMALPTPDKSLAASLGGEGRTGYPLARPRRCAGRFRPSVSWLSDAVRCCLIRSRRMKRQCSLSRGSGRPRALGCFWLGCCVSAGPPSDHSKPSARMVLLCRVEQALRQKLPRSDPARAGKQAASDMGGELVQRVQLSHVLEQRNETGARVTLVGHEQ